MRGVAWRGGLGLGGVLTLGACVLATDFDALSGGRGDAGVPEDAAAAVGVDAGADAAVCAADASFVDDPKSCGACGHDCLGGDCLGGACVPIPLAAGVGGITNLRADGDELYVAATGQRALLHLPKTGGPLVTAAQGNTVYEIGFNAKAIFYTGDASLRRIDRLGANDAQLSMDQNVISLAATDVDVYWCNYAYGNSGAGAIYRRHEADGAVTQVLNGITKCETLALVGTDVVYGQNGNDGTPGAVWRVPQAGGTPVQLSSNGARRLVVDNGWIYFVTYGSQQVRRVLLDGTSETLLGASPAGTVQQGNVAVDASYVYWTVNQDPDKGGGVYRSPKAGGTTSAIAANRNNPIGLVVDDRAIYWTEDGSGSVFKLAK